jgi:glycogen debranching enzyme
MNPDSNQAESLDHALTLLRHAASPDGFVAAATNHDNYLRVWGRDSMIISLAALQTNDNALHAAVKASLTTLKDAQGPHGQIPSNVNAASGQASYGGTAGRVDASLWFIIGAHQYWRVTRDDETITTLIPCLKRIEHVLGAWEFNGKGLIYVPETGDWADEYIQHGYVLYDQLLYWRALHNLADIYQAARLPGSRRLTAKADHLKQLIRANYWFFDCETENEHVYHPLIFKKGCQAAENKGAYWMSFFSPAGYGYRFDAFANVLAMLLDIADENQRTATADYITQHVMPDKLKILPAFSPVITPVDKDWPILQSNFSNTFKNKPNEYHNGGLWPMITGFYVAELARRGARRQAEEYLAAIHHANKLDAAGDGWGFYEYINGSTFKPGGTRRQVWSASAAVMGHFALRGRMPLS